MIFTFDLKLFVYLSISFILFTVVGTLSHELGHFTVAKTLGYNAYISYSSTHWWNDNTPYNSVHNLYIILGGPIQTILTGIAGLFYIIIKRKSILNKNNLDFFQWLIIFIALFWLRQLANFINWIAGYLIKGKPTFNSDEIRLAIELNLPIWSISFATALIALFVLVFIVFFIIPKNNRFTFITAGLLGGIAGLFLWMSWLGKYLLP